MSMVAIVLIIVVLTLAGAAYGIYTRRGSGIEQHPRGGDHVESPGVGVGVGEGDSLMSSRTEGNDTTFDSHGTE